MTVDANYQPIPSSAPPFAYEFVSKMRASEEVKAKPSVRQTQAIPQFLSARFFRKGELDLDDFVEAAVFTSYPADQEIARLIAEEILLGVKKEPEPPLQAQTAQAPQVESKTKSALEEVMAQIRREQELAKTIKKDKVQAGFDYLQELRRREDTSLYHAAMDYLKEGDVVLRGITSDEELRSQSSDELLERMGGLTANDILNSQTLGVLDEVCESSASAESIAGQALRGDPTLQEQFKDLAARDPSTAAKALSLMEQMGSLDQATLDQLDSLLQQSISNLGEVSDYASHLQRTPENMQEHIDSAASEYALSQSMEFASSIKQKTGKDMARDVMDAYDRQYDNGGRKNVDMRQLADYAMDTPSWKDLVEKMTQDILDDAMSRSSPSDYLRQKVKEAAAKMDQMKTSAQKKAWGDMIQKLADRAVETSPNKTHLRQTVRDLSSHGAVPSKEAIRNTGTNLGMSEDEILELLNPSFQVIKNLIKMGIDDFDRLNNLMSTAGLTPNQLGELADLADQLGNQSALGAVAHQDLMAALGGQSPMPRGYGGHTMHGGGQPGYGQFDPSRAEKVMGGLLGGPASNVVKIWYTYRDQIPQELRKKLKDIARKLLIDLGQRYAKATMGSSMLGGIQQSTTVRPFRIGDDIDLIDLEETIEAILSSGRSDFDALNPEDFLITETYQGHRAFYWALDKSGSMHSPNKLGMLAISVMAGLYGVQKDDFGVVLFDSDTHVVKEIADKTVSVDKVAADLLEVRASGGTGGRTAMRLALQNFEDTRSKEKIFIFSTDAYLSDQQECEDLAVQMKHHDIQMIVLAPKFEYDLHAANRLAKLNHGVVLDIASIEELPEKLLRLTNY